VSSAGPAEIFDLGYQGYDGERTSRWQRRRAIWRDGIRISLGLGRGTGAKVAPWILIAMALVPMAVLVVLAAFLGSVPSDSNDFELPSYAEYYQFAIIPLALFAAVVAPLLVCPDRADGVLSLYAARPITARDYVGSRWLGFFTVAATVAIIPEAVLFAWNLLDASDTGMWIRDNWDVIPRFLASGLTVAVVFTTLALLVASFTNRRAYAAIGTVAVLFIGGAVGGIAHDNFNGTVSDVLSEANILRSLVDTVHWIFGDSIDAGFPPGWVSALWVLGLAVVLAVWLLRRTERMVRG
jgi:ABC-2 type transport system permease protein